MPPALAPPTEPALLLSELPLAGPRLCSSVRPRTMGSGMTKKRWFLVLACVLILGIGIAAYGMWPRESAINAENAAKIRPGQSLWEVEVILGGPERDDSSGPVTLLTPDDDHTSWDDRPILVD